MILRNKKTGEIKDVESLGHEKSLRDKYGRQITLSWNTEYENLGECRTYHSLAELNADWEDVPEEPKEYWYIDCDGEIEHDKDREDVPEDTKGFWYIRCGGAVKQNEDSSLEKPHIDRHKEIGNYFETEEEAEKAVEKLKAWKRLEDKGFEFNGKEVFSEGLLEIDGVLPALKGADNAERLKIIDDLDLLFGGEE